MDEFEWEDFLKKNDEMVDKYSALFEKYFDHPDRDAIIDREMGWDGERKGEDMGDHAFDDIEDDSEADESWKSAIEPEPEIFHRQRSPAAEAAHQLCVKVLKLFHALPESISIDSVTSNFVQGVMTAAGKMAAAGTPIDESDRDELGLNLALCKRALSGANIALSSLRGLKETRLFEQRVWQELTRDTTSVRNAIAIHVVDLRERIARAS